SMDVGVPITGTGIQNDFADPTRQAAGIERFKLWCDVANAIGAPIVRIFSGGLPPPPATRDQWLAGMSDTLGQVAMIRKATGLKAGGQNHGDRIATADQMIDVLGRVNMPDGLGADDDTGYFYEGGDVCAGLTRTCQCQTVSVEEKYIAI